MADVQGEIFSIGYGGISVLNAIPTGIGSTVAIDMKTTVFVREADANSRQSQLTDSILDHFTSLTGKHFSVQIQSEIPQGSGLKSSSAVSVALIDSLCRITGLREYPPTLSAVISKKAGISLTGAFDDAVSAYMGGCFLTDNLKMRVETEITFPDDLVFVILYDGSSRTVDPAELRKWRSDFLPALAKARNGDILGAMNLNGHLVASHMGYDMDVIRNLDRLGAIASGVTGNGPAIFAVFRDGEEGPAYDLIKTMGSAWIARMVKHAGKD